MTLNAKDRREIQDTIENEGFEYTFRDYTDFGEIEDEKLHELIDKFTEAADELEEYINGD